ncbi:hypothetical protein GGQ87_002801 [Brevundimonas alba]|uniref:CBM-cenC domain-containing protein n=1 Tax=Brevundimonas alba TaxID=74314 RepID=A0A7X5YM77_9CAUL|nr:hypothetical protein [Brevundimonas alba]NJC42506.1 hypothetical protein [Brevundimonas alba]
MSLLRRSFSALALVVTLAAPAGSALAQDAPAAARPSMLERAVNTVHVTSWSVYGPHETHEILEATVQGGHALRVNVSTPGANPWDTGAGSLTTKPVKAGDVMLLAVWLRTERAPEGSGGGRAIVRLQGSAEPYPEIGSAAVTPGGEWKLYFANGVAARDFAPGEMGATVQLAGASQTIDLGPVFILDMGPDYDRSTLPAN